jgi:uncharacterized coiled-coil protein SlyX
MRFDVYIHNEDFGANSKLNQILSIVRNILGKEEEQKVTIAELNTKVTEQSTVVGSTKLLLEQLAQMLKDAIAANDPAAIQAVADMITANTQALSDAVIANTPVV